MRTRPHRHVRQEVVLGPVQALACGRRSTQRGSIHASRCESLCRRPCCTGDAKRTWRRCKPPGCEPGRNGRRSVKAMMSCQDGISGRRTPTGPGRQSAGGLCLGYPAGVLTGHHPQPLGFVSLSPAPEEWAPSIRSVCTDCPRSQLSASRASVSWHAWRTGAQMRLWKEPYPSTAALRFEVRSRYGPRIVACFLLAVAKQVGDICLCVVE